MNKCYTVEETTSCAFLMTSLGLYNEVLIRNYVGVPLVAIYRNGEQKIIPSVAMQHQAGPALLIDIRETNGSRIDSNPHHRGAEIAIPAKRIIIPGHQLEHEPVYIEELNVMITTEDKASVVTHPDYRRTYDEIMDEVLRDLAQHDPCLNIRIMVNDPSYMYDYLYIHLFGKTIPIVITHYPQQDPLVTVSITQNYRVVNRMDFRFQDIVESDGVLELASGFSVAVGVSDQQLSRGLGTIKRRITCEPEKVEADIADLRKRHRQELKQQAEKMQLDLKRTETQVANLEHQLGELKTEKLRLEEYSERWKGICQAENERYLHRRSEEVADSKVKIAATSVRKGEIELEAVLIKTIGALAMAGLGWWIKTVYDQRTKR